MAQNCFAKKWKHLPFDKKRFWKIQMFQLPKNETFINRGLLLGFIFRLPELKDCLTGVDYCGSF